MATSFAEVLRTDATSMYVGGRRISGVRRASYSYSTHFRARSKIIKTVLNGLKLLVILAIYIIVDSVSVSQKADIRRKIWTKSILLFFNWTFLAAICLVLALRVTTN